MFRQRLTVLAILSTVLAAGRLRAQTAGVSIPAWVEEDHCSSAPQFEATLNGRPSKVISQLGPRSDQIILAVLDLTGDSSLIEVAKNALTSEIAKLPPNAWMGLLQDSDGLHVLADPAPNRQPLLKAINEFTSINQPGMLESMDSALALADGILRKFPVRVSVLYITDGNIYNYRVDYTNPVINSSDPHDLSRIFPDALIQDKISKLMSDASTLEAPLFVVHLNYRSDTLNTSYQNGLLMLADATGGRAEFCRSVGEIPSAIESSIGRISQAWRLNLSVPPKFHSYAQIHLSAPCAGEDARLSWRTRLRSKEG